MKSICAFITLVFSISLFAQKKVLDHTDVDAWNTIKNEVISSDGQFLVYNIQQEDSDSRLILKDAQGGTIFEYFRACKGQYTYDSNYLAFTINPLKD